MYDFGVVLNVHEFDAFISSVIKPVTDVVVHEFVAHAGAEVCVGDSEGSIKLKGSVDDVVGYVPAVGSDKLIHWYTEHAPLCVPDEGA